MSHHLESERVDRMICGGRARDGERRIGTVVRRAQIEAADQPIDVRVSLFESAKYYVLGQVYLPGPKVYTGRDTVLHAIAEAQPNPMAWASRSAEPFHHD